MPIIKKGALTLVVLFAMFVAGWFHYHTDTVFKHVGVQVSAQAEEGVYVNQRAPEFKLNTLKGEASSYQAGANQVTVVHFFATWCYPCQEEMPLIVELDKKLTAEGSSFIPVNLTSSEQGVEQLQPFLTHYKAAFNPLLDEEGLVQDTYQIFGVPTTLLINEEGIIVKRVNGPLNQQEYEQILNAAS